MKFKLINSQLFTNNLYSSISKCKLCPRACGINRLNGEMGFCKVGSEPLVANIVIHKGEEPIVSGKKGICNVFFAHCNLECAFCQNYQISRNDSFQNDWLDNYDDIVLKIITILDKGINILGFVSPTHQVPQMVKIINELIRKGYKPRIVYNTNSYDNRNVLHELYGIVDVYLPDIKYFKNEFSMKYSNVQNYFSVALSALKEMIWQKGTTISLGEDGLIDSGVIVRHLLLPNMVNDSINIFRNIANEIDTNIAISVMSQYYPTGFELNKFHEINRKIYSTEYRTLVDEIKKIGFYKGWLQDMDSNNSYLPDFSKKTPFL